jgi:regulator of sigma E protease
MAWYEIIFYILIFVLCLSVLIIVHELGHLGAAKIFKVYCMEFSVGFGPAIIHKRRKGGETYFSLRAVPFGGYVSMYAEGTELPDGEQVDPKRSLENIAKWKRAIIMVAGVVMNSVLALTLFFVNNIAFQDKYIYPAIATVEENSLAATVGIKSNDYIRLYGQKGNEATDEDKSVWNQEFFTYGLYYLGDVELDKAVVYYTNGEQVEAGQFINLGLIKSFSDTNLADLICLYQIKDGAITKEAVTLTADVEKVEIVIRTVPVIKVDDKAQLDFENTVPHKLPLTPKLVGEGEKATYVFESFGYSLSVIADKPLNFGQALGQSFVDFGEGSIAIIKGLGSLFTPEGVSKVNGIVGLGVVSSNVLKNLGLGKFIELWAIISVNLAVINLLPFPGLDGWHLLVLAIEGITKKKVPEKVKSIVSFIGIGILFVLMGVILIKDVIGIFTGTLLIGLL